MKKRITDLII